MFFFKTKSFYSWVRKEEGGSEVETWNDVRCILVQPFLCRQSCSLPTFSPTKQPSISPTISPISFPTVSEAVVDEKLISTTLFGSLVTFLSVLILIFSVLLVYSKRKLKNTGRLVFVLRI